MQAQIANASSPIDTKTSHTVQELFEVVAANATADIPLNNNASKIFFTLIPLCLNDLLVSFGNYLYLPYAA